MKVNKANKEFVGKLAFVLNEPESDVLNYLINLGRDKHIAETYKTMRRR